MKYDFLPCPVCKVPFGEKNDDIVVCPICGTPHHRECYKSLNHCVNEDKHNEGFVWVNPITVESHPINPAPKPVNSIFNSKENSIENRIENRIKENKSDEKEQYQTDSQFRPIAGDEMIGDIKVKTYADYIKINVPSYIPKFMKLERLNKKVSWNWAAFLTAFICPPIWFFYRKMFKEGFLIAILCYIIPLIFIGTFVQYSNDFTEVFNKAMQSGTSVKNSIATPAEPLACRVAGYVDLIAVFFSGMFADKLYMRKAKKDILKLKSKTENETEFEEKILRTGGITIGYTILAVVLIYAVFNGVALIYTVYGCDVAYFINHLLGFNVKK